MYKLMKTVLEIIKSLRNEGYINDFRISGKIIKSDTTGKTYRPGELIIEKTERYEGDSNPSDNAVIYVLTAKDGAKGILIDSYGAYADPELAGIINDIPVREENELEDNGTPGNFVKKTR